jgi:hypothetical protein
VPPVRGNRFARFGAPAVTLIVVAAGCGPSSSAPSSAPPPTTATSGSTAAGSGWLSAQAKRWNAALNDDQNGVDVAVSGSGRSVTTVLSRLTPACEKLLGDAERAQTVPPAPTATLRDAWYEMLAATVTYAKNCLALTRSESSSDLHTWQESLQPMNSANARWNQVVTTIRNGSG